MCAPVGVYLVVEQLKQPWRVELVVLDHRLLWGAGRLGSPRLRHSQGISEVGVNGIVGLALSLRRLDPADEAGSLRQGGD